MKYSFREAMIGAKWKCVWNKVIVFNFQLKTESRQCILVIFLPLII